MTDITALVDQITVGVIIDGKIPAGLIPGTGGEAEVEVEVEVLIGAAIVGIADQEKIDQETTVDLQVLLTTAVGKLIKVA